MVNTKQFGIALCAGASLLLAIALNPAISNFVDFAFFKKAASLNEIADCYSDFGIFAAGLIKNLTAPEGIIAAGLSALSFFALFILLNMDVFSEPKSRTLKDGKLGRQNQITSSRKIARANIVWTDEDHGSDPTICIGNIGGKSVFAEATHACAIARRVRSKPGARFTKLWTTTPGTAGETPWLWTRRLKCTPNLTMRSRNEAIRSEF